MNTAGAWALGVVLGALFFVIICVLLKLYIMKQEEEDMYDEDAYHTKYIPPNRNRGGHDASARKQVVQINFGMIADHTPLGMSMTQHDHVVKSVAPGSLAQRSGILMGDRVLRVRDVPIDSLGHDEATALLRTPPFAHIGPSPLEITVERDLGQAQLQEPPQLQEQQLEQVRPNIRFDDTSELGKLAPVNLNAMPRQQQGALSTVRGAMASLPLACFGVSPAASANGSSRRRSKNQGSQVPPSVASNVHGSRPAPVQFESEAVRQAGFDGVVHRLPAVDAYRAKPPVAFAGLSSHIENSKHPPNYGGRQRPQTLRTRGSLSPRSPQARGYPGFADRIGTVGGPPVLQVQKHQQQQQQQQGAMRAEMGQMQDQIAWLSGEISKLEGEAARSREPVTAAQMETQIAALSTKLAEAKAVTTFSETDRQDVIAEQKAHEEALVELRAQLEAVSAHKAQVRALSKARDARARELRDKQQALERARVGAIRDEKLRVDAIARHGKRLLQLRAQRDARAARTEAQLLALEQEVSHLEATPPEEFQAHRPILDVQVQAQAQAQAQAQKEERQEAEAKAQYKEMLYKIM